MYLYSYLFDKETQLYERIDNWTPLHL